MDSESRIKIDQAPPEPVTSGELNSWRRGFTPQAEIWNGRMAMFGLAVGLISLVVLHNFLGT
tara:strand:+ start:501 stop:686 length:186 start_codon:yes stop_codon:yes gene_type:complete